MTNRHVNSAVTVSIIIPALNEASLIQHNLQQLQSLRALGCELIVVDGNSCDETVAQASPQVDRVLRCPQGRARQMNAGAKTAKGEWLLFLHADTCLPADTDEWLALLTTSVFSWGFFSIRLSGSHYLFRFIERAMTFRSRLTSIATGDQCLFVRRALFEDIGGFADIPLMEDIAFSQSLRNRAKPLCWPTPVISSSRRWEQRGIASTVLLMWCLRLAYFFGASPEKLHGVYYD
ncbi:MAG: TIGR04283 family arsenosugar biosynthesis glycosyltransferase [Pseudomonadales bacterium]